MTAAFLTSIDEVPPQAGYELIYADPAWKYKTKSPTASSRPGQEARGVFALGADYYYDTMTIPEISEMVVKSISARDAVLGLWATTPLLPEILPVVDAWGFKYKTLVTWRKLRCKGGGYWFRGHTEHLIIAVRGKVKAFRSLEPNIVDAPVEEHSRKPDIFRALLTEAACPRLSGPETKKIELFATERHIGWDAVGRPHATANKATPNAD